MKTLKLNLCKTFENEFGRTILLPKEQVNCTVETLESDAFLSNGHPDTDWLENLAEKKTGIKKLSLLQIN